MASLSAQFEDLRRTAQSCLAATGSGKDAKTYISAMAETAIPVSDRFRHIPAETFIKENFTGKAPDEVLEVLGMLVKALNVLEKYGCNLMNPNRPKYWRTVKFNNPVFRASVDTVTGGRDILRLYGYVNELPDGLAFPDDITGPDVEKVAEVATEVMALGVELDSLLKGTHSHPEFFEKTIPSLPPKQQKKDKEELASDAVVFQAPHPKPRTSVIYRSAPQPTLPPSASQSSPKSSECDICGKTPSFLCDPCGLLPYCETCDETVHRHPNKIGHTRQRIRVGQQEKCGICGTSSVTTCCFTCGHRLCTECDSLYHSHPTRKNHTRKTVNKMTTVKSMSPAQPESMQQSSMTEWECKSCTAVNAGTSVLCQVCERPRLARRIIPPKETPKRETETKWECRTCTFHNAKANTRCEMCDTPQEDLLKPQPAKYQDPHLKESEVTSNTSDIRKQALMREEGLKLLSCLKEADKRGISPEEVSAALQPSKGSSPFDWLRSELPLLLDEICALATSVQPDNNAEHTGRQTEVLLSRAEAKQAWLFAGGDTQKAVNLLLQNRRFKLHALHAMGFKNTLACEKALFACSGDLEGALAQLQHSLLEPLRNRIWKKDPQIHIDIRDQDQERLCRRLLGLYNLPSWGRCQLAISLLEERDVEYSLEDVIQAVKDHNDKDFILRILKNECQMCFSSFPRSKMQALTACQCSMCSECFVLHFTVALRDKHIRDMVCPVCYEPDINNPDAFDNYFSLLDTQLRMCLETEVYQLLGKKLMEHTILKDPKFLWCCHCTNGFINDKDELKVTCPSCHQSFCSKCKKPWEDQHKGITCDEFQTWKRMNDPEYQKQGLAGFLRDNGINCPSCKFQYALAKGGCMHFTCSQCRHEFCSGCNNPYHKKQCSYPGCVFEGLHAHHPRDCLSYLRDWPPDRLQALLQSGNEEFNTNPPEGVATGTCGVMEQKDGTQANDAPCGIETKEGHAGFCNKHYIEYLVSLINGHSLDPTPLFDKAELTAACKRHQVNVDQGHNEDDEAYLARLRQDLMAIPLGENVPRKM